MVPAAPQKAPRTSEASQITAAVPPAAATFIKRLFAKNPIHSPSGEKNGPVAPSLPLIGVISNALMGRRNSWVVPLTSAANASLRPSGEIARFGRDTEGIEFGWS